jgi:ribonuclease G
MPGMQAAFVDIGLDRAAFLHANDVQRPAPVRTIDGVESPAPVVSGPVVVPSISELLREGGEVVVQVVKDPIGTKGARLTTQLSIPSRYLVLLPQSKVIGVSSRIEDEIERARLKSLVAELSAPLGSPGYIVRTNAEGQPAEALAEDIGYLGRAWALVEQQVQTARVGACIYEDLSLPMRAVRDLMRRDVEKVKIDSRETCDRLRAFAAQYMPGLAEKIEHYTGARPVFDLYGVEDEIQHALEKQVPLKSGGYLVIDQTEAMTTVDVATEQGSSQQIVGEPRILGQNRAVQVRPEGVLIHHAFQPIGDVVAEAVQHAAHCFDLFGEISLSAVVLETYQRAPLAGEVALDDSVADTAFRACLGPGIEQADTGQH